MHPPEPRTFGTLLSDSFSILKRHSNMISRAIFFFWLLPLIPLLLTVIPLIQQWPANVTLENINETSVTPEIAGLLLAVLFCAVTGGIVAVAGYIVMISIAVSDREEESLRLRDHVSPIFKRHLWWVILVFICAMLAEEIALSPLEDQTQLLGGAIYILSSLVLGSILGMKLFLTIPALVLEDRGPIKAVERSWQLTKGYFWQTMGRYFAITLIGAAAVMVPFMFALVATTMIVKDTGAENIIGAMQDFGTMMTVFLFFLPSLILMMLVLVIEPIYRSEVFYDLRFRKGEFTDQAGLQ
jgi:hypothetical protein